MTEVDAELERIRAKKMKMLMEMAKRPPQPVYSAPVYLTDADFDEKINSIDIALVDFYGEWCHPCKAIAPILEAIAQQYAGKIMIGKVDVDRNPVLARRFRIQSIPLVIAFYKGKPVHQILGARPANAYLSVVNALLKKKEEE